MSAEVADACKPWVTSLICGHDAVPRFSGANVVRIKRELAQVDWSGELMKNLLEMEYVQVGGGGGGGRQGGG